MFRSAFLAGSILALALVTSSCGPAIITRPQFTPVASLSDDCDRIRLTTSPSQAGPGSVQIFLATGTPRPGSAIWWKEIHCFIGDRSCGILHAGDGPSTATAPAELDLLPSELNRAKLVFTKPKVLGAPTDVYQMIELSPLINQRALFTWENDRCP